MKTRVSALYEVPEKELDYSSDTRELFIVDTLKLKKKRRKTLIENCTFFMHNHNKLK